MLRVVGVRWTVLWRSTSGCSDGDGQSDLSPEIAATADLFWAVIDDGRSVVASRFGVQTTPTTATASIADGVWTHGAETVSANNGIRFFIDGVQGPCSWTASSSTARVGAEREDSTGAVDRFNGSIDEVRISNGLRD